LPSCSSTAVRCMLFTAQASELAAARTSNPIVCAPVLPVRSTLGLCCGASRAYKRSSSRAYKGSSSATGKSFDVVDLDGEEPLQSMIANITQARHPAPRTGLASPRLASPCPAPWRKGTAAHHPARPSQRGGVTDQLSVTPLCNPTQRFVSSFAFGVPVCL
jgi:hypothetical protein